MGGMCLLQKGDAGIRDRVSETGHVSVKHRPRFPRWFSALCKVHPEPFKTRTALSSSVKPGLARTGPPCSSHALRSRLPPDPSQERAAPGDCSARRSRTHPPPPGWQWNRETRHREESWSQCSSLLIPSSLGLRLFISKRSGFDAVSGSLVFGQ
ncbi:unnamed protein product [Rangifer tarandus platyrhynchus]|uniref:Uncharacterized protein n=1 Tax=Rangifer tarandus platyrhynchus TaxID=3082113 RepID=A0AC59Z9F1_RANTA